MKKDIIIKSANSNGKKIFIQKMVEKCKLLNDKGLMTWNIESLTEDKLNQQYINPQYFVCYLNDQFIGGFILLTSDDFFWPENTEDDSFYIHKLLVCNGFNGNGYGNLIMNWIKEYGKKNGKKFLRLDYFKSKQKLKLFYEENGFYKVDEIKYQDRDINIKVEYQL